MKTAHYFKKNMAKSVFCPPYPFYIDSKRKAKKIR